MKLALVRYKYNPYGGAERIIERLARELIKAGTFSNISILSKDWRSPSGSHSDSLDSTSIEHHPIRSSGWTRYGRHKSFLDAATRALGDMQGNHITQTHERLPGCDIYRAGDGVHKAWLHRLGKQRSWLGRQSLELDPYHQLICKNELLIANNPKTLIVANSELVKRELSEYLGAPEERVRLIPNSIDTNYWKSRRENALPKQEARKILGLNPDLPCVLFVGSGFDRKGVQPLVEATGLSQDHQLLVVGADKHLAAYRALAQKCAPGRVKFTGGLDSIDIPLAASDIFALPSLYDSFSNAVLEAMAYGLPVITSQDTGIANWFRERESGGTVCERNAEALLDSIRESLRFRKTMEVNAISTASKFDHGIIIPKWLELYKETLGRK